MNTHVPDLSRETATAIADEVETAERVEATADHKAAGSLRWRRRIIQVELEPAARWMERERVVGWILRERSCLAIDPSRRIAAEQDGKVSLAGEGRVVTGGPIGQPRPTPVFQIPRPSRLVDRELDRKLGEEADFNPLAAVHQQFVVDHGRHRHVPRIGTARVGQQSPNAGLRVEAPQVVIRGQQKAIGRHAAEQVEISAIGNQRRAGSGTWAAQTAEICPGIRRFVVNPELVRCRGQTKVVVLAAAEQVDLIP